MRTDTFLNILQNELVVALGCTEPVAIALAAAKARTYVDGNIDKITVYASAGIIKNALAVGIPGTGLTGIDFVAALGAIAGNAEKQLEVLADIKPEDITVAQEMVERGISVVHLADTPKKLYIEVIIEAETRYAKVVITDNHTNITLIEVDGQIIDRGGCANASFKSSKEDRSELTIDSIVEFVNTVDLAELGLVKQSIELNRKAGLDGLEHAYGLEVGKTIKENVQKGILSDDLISHAMALAAAGSDARMAGSSMPVMANSGSGNQGIAATNPVIAAAEKLDATEEQLIRAAALSHLVTIHIKSKFGRLSALCGVTVSGTGASCGITYLLGGGKAEIKAAIQNMLGNVSGMMCDGAKGGCAMKVATCTSAAVQSALLASKGMTISSTNGFIENEAEKTIDNFCRIGNEATSEIDKLILEMMLNKDL
ncbi:L-serine ammonia-lyase, iron-sulfur-dependent, subunit alpha [Paenibacillus sp. HWE-109]|uniref:L-cysteine desulfidase family protein n=1 Tax=Paenibacillus sp. HWE-109 TaxID=1306526 RepID=UPI001EDD7BC2|nr:L-serine ammonia-lyase, iron-sulfur-dependent, subunit alpha [Paenibacillus sp. HWE-109]UKS23834.1 L-serine ammonia-lyase, iron-sulfur-dependent, subunit alpha [Paenibacillus sp. HWE-109]